MLGWIFLHSALSRAAITSEEVRPSIERYGATGGRGNIGKAAAQRCSDVSDRCQKVLKR